MAFLKNNTTYEYGRVIVDKEFIVVAAIVMIILSSLATFTIWGVSSFIPLNKAEWSCTTKDDAGDCLVYTKHANDTDTE